MRHDHIADWLRELRLFLSVEPIEPPASTTREIRSYVRTRLKPAFNVVAVKVAGLHGFAALVITLFCPQLGVGPLFFEHGIMHLFMQFGPFVCAALCGALLLGAGALITVVALRPEELRIAANHSFVAAALLSSAAFAGLMIAGGGAERIVYAAWLGGACIGGWTVLKLGTKIRLGHLLSPRTAP